MPSTTVVEEVMLTENRLYSLDAIPMACLICPIPGPF